MKTVQKLYSCISMPTPSQFDGKCGNGILTRTGDASTPILRGASTNTLVVYGTSEVRVKYTAVVMSIDLSYRYKVKSTN
jgi:hypothetical protein